MSESALLDTHTWIWLMEDDDRLSSKSVKMIDEFQFRSCLFVSAASVWELGSLERSGRITLRFPLEEWLRKAYSDGGVQQIPINDKIALASTRLPGEIHRDPIDRILVATARLHSLTLLTRDRLLLAYAEHGHLIARKI